MAENPCRNLVGVKNIKVSIYPCDIGNTERNASILNKNVNFVADTFHYSPSTIASSSTPDGNPQLQKVTAWIEFSFYLDADDNVTYYRNASGIDITVEMYNGDTITGRNGILVFDNSGTDGRTIPIRAEFKIPLLEIKSPRS